jgi:hypothetical protein
VSLPRPKSRHPPFCCYWMPKMNVHVKDVPKIPKNYWLQSSYGMDINTRAHTALRAYRPTFIPACLWMEATLRKRTSTFTPIHSVIATNFYTYQSNSKMLEHSVYKTHVITNFHIKEHKEMWRKHSPVRFSQSTFQCRLLHYRLATPRQSCDVMPRLIHTRGPDVWCRVPHSAQSNGGPVSQVCSTYENDDFSDKYLQHFKNWNSLTVFNICINVSIFGVLLTTKKFVACVRGHNRNRLRRESVFVLLEEG